MGGDLGGIQKRGKLNTMKIILDQFNRVKSLENSNFIANTDWKKLSKVDVILIKAMKKRSPSIGILYI